MADKLLVIMATLDSRDVSKLLPPLLQAKVAAAMEYEVEVIFSGETGQLAMNGTAQALSTEQTDLPNLYAHIQQAHQAGVVFKLCIPAMKFTQHELIAEIAETVGDTYVINEAMDDSVVCFTY